MLKVQRRQCETCIFHPDSPLDLKRLLNAVRERHPLGSIEFSGYRVCHHSKNAVCAGFWARYKDNFVVGQIAQRLGYVELVEDDTLGEDE